METFHQLTSACEANLVAITRSTNLKAKLKFDIGRYELASSASNVGFLSREKTRADFCVSGRSPDCSDTLQNSLSTEARASEARFTSQVGTGSNEQCLSGVRDGRLVTSSTLTDSKLESGVVTSCVLITGGN